MMGLRERRVRRYIDRMSSAASAAEHGAVYDNDLGIGLKKDDVDLAYELVPDTHYLLVMRDQEGVPHGAFVGINAPAVWHCHLQNVRVMVLTSIAMADDKLFASNDLLRERLQEDSGSALCDPRDVLMAPLTDHEIEVMRKGWRTIHHRDPPPLVQRMIDQRSIRPIENPNGEMPS